MYYTLLRLLILHNLVISQAPSSKSKVEPQFIYWKSFEFFFCHYWGSVIQQNRILKAIDFRMLFLFHSNKELVTFEVDMNHVNSLQSKPFAMCHKKLSCKKKLLCILCPCSTWKCCISNFNNNGSLVSRPTSGVNPTQLGQCCWQAFIYIPILYSLAWRSPPFTTKWFPVTKSPIHLGLKTALKIHFRHSNYPLIHFTRTVWVRYLTGKGTIYT